MWWHETNDAIISNSSGYLTHDQVRYPNGIQSVMKCVPSKGLKCGHHSDCGQESRNDQGPVSEGYEQQYISLCVEWQIDG